MMIKNKNIQKLIQSPSIKQVWLKELPQTKTSYYFKTISSSFKRLVASKDTTYQDINNQSKDKNEVQKEDVRDQNLKQEISQGNDSSLEKLKKAIVNSPFIKNLLSSDRSRESTSNNLMKLIDMKIIQEQSNEEQKEKIEMDQIRQIKREEEVEQEERDSRLAVSLSKNVIDVDQMISPKNNEQDFEDETFEMDLQNDEDKFINLIQLPSQHSNIQTVNYHSQFRDMLSEPEGKNTINLNSSNTNNNSNQRKQNQNKKQVQQNDDQTNQNNESAAKLYQNQQMEFSFREQNKEKVTINQEEIEQIRYDIVELLRSSSIKMDEKIQYLKLAATEHTLIPALSQFILDFFQHNLNSIKKLDQDIRLDAIYIYSLCFNMSEDGENSFILQNFMKDIRNMNLDSLSECAKVIYLLNQNKIFDKNILIHFFTFFKASIQSSNPSQQLSIEQKIEYFDLFVIHQKNIHISKQDQQESNQLKIMLLNNGIIDILEDISKHSQTNNILSLRFLQALSNMRYEIKIIRDIQRRCIDIEQIHTLNNCQFLILNQIIYQFNLHFEDVIIKLFEIYLQKLPSIVDRDNNPDYVYQFISFYQHIGTENIKGVDDEIINQLKTLYNTQLYYILSNVQLPFPILMTFLLVQASNNKFKDLDIIEKIVSTIDKKRRKSGMKNDQICLPLAFSYYQEKDPDMWRFFISSFDSRKIKDPTRFSQFAQGFQYCIQNVPELKESLELKMAIIECQSKLKQFSEAKQDISFNTNKIAFQKQFKVNFFVTKLILEKVGLQINVFEIIEGIFFNTITIKSPQFLNIDINQISVEEIARKINFEFTYKPSLTLKKTNNNTFNKNEDIVILLDKPRFFGKEDLIFYNLNYLQELGYNTVSLGKEIIQECNPLDYQSTYKFAENIILNIKNHINNKNNNLSQKK